VLPTLQRSLHIRAHTLAFGSVLRSKIKVIKAKRVRLMLHVRFVGCDYSTGSLRASSGSLNHGEHKNHKEIIFSYPLWLLYARRPATTSPIGWKRGDGAPTCSH
jgi:hypothetical protein